MHSPPQLLNSPRPWSLYSAVGLQFAVSHFREDFEPIDPLEELSISPGVVGETYLPQCGNGLD